jgi:hypothetical protein
MRATTKAAPAVIKAAAARKPVNSIARRKMTLEEAAAKIAELTVYRDYYAAAMETNEKTFTRKFVEEETGLKYLVMLHGAKRAHGGVVQLTAFEPDGRIADSKVVYFDVYREQMNRAAAENGWSPFNIQMSGVLNELFAEREKLER